MRPTEAYRVSETIDEYGREGGLIGYFSDFVLAERAAKGKGYYGGDGRVSKVHLIISDGYYYELASVHPITLNLNLVELAAKKRAAALAKLTLEERTLLGIKD